MRKSFCLIITLLIEIPISNIYILYFKVKDGKITQYLSI